MASQSGKAPGSGPTPQAQQGHDFSGFSQMSTISYSEDVLANFLVEERLVAEDLEDQTPRQKLSRMLTLRSILPTASSFAVRHEQAQASGVAGVYRKIGAGSCGYIFEEVGTVKIIKLAMRDDEQLYNDYRMHTLIMERMAASPLTSEALAIPRVQWFTTKDDKRWWDKHRPLFPRSRGLSAHPQDILCAERIWPIPKAIREALIEQWCPASLIEKAKADKLNQDCLIRLYLGMLTPKFTQPPLNFSLRNFKLFADMASELNSVEFSNVAEIMGQALALLHWWVGTDARDVEFVLGSSPTYLPQQLDIPLAFSALPSHKTNTRERVEIPNFRRRAIRLWLLDFNQCLQIKRDETAIQLAVDAFFENDPYYPRPFRNVPAQEGLWDRFRGGYEFAGKWVFENGIEGASDAQKKLPTMFLDAVEREQRSRMFKEA